MAEDSVTHDTVVVHRTYAASAKRVYAAWTDAAELERWYVPGDASWKAKMLKHDFSVGGGKRFTFGPPDQTFTEDCVYVDIVPERRICYAMTISRGDKRITVSMVTVELIPRGARCDVRVTDQLAILDGGDTSKDRERGWGETLDKLSPALASSAA
jgi:uncharacterized protein YndB with AHSA1/START domain